MNPPTPDRTDHLTLLDRDESILRFNLRVLDWARRTDVPLLERLRYLCIVSSNLDEFFEVRAELHLSASRQGKHAGSAAPTSPSQSPSSPAVQVAAVSCPEAVLRHTVTLAKPTCSVTARNTSPVAS